MNSKRTLCSALCSDFVFCLLSLAFGLLLSLWPNLLSWWRSGDWTWIADDDNLLYLGIASKTYFNLLSSYGASFSSYLSATLSDPTFLDHKPVMYPWVLFMPGIVIARVLHLGPFGIDLLWRIWAGSSIGAAWYLLIRQFQVAPRLALLASALLQADSGILYGQPIVKHFLNLISALGQMSLPLLPGIPILTPQWRVITPGLSLAFFISFILLMTRATRERSEKCVLFAGLSLGFLFYVYFYFWTTAVVGLIFSCILDRERWQVYLRTLCIGLGFGLPEVVYSAHLKGTVHPDSLPRIDSFLPIPHFSELLIPKTAILILVLSFLWIRKNRRELLFLWALAASAICLLNHQIVTGLQIANFHWNYAMGPCLSALLVLVVLQPGLQPGLKPELGRTLVHRLSLRGSKPVQGALILVFFLVFCLHLGGGFVLRTLDAVRTERSEELTSEFRNYKAQRAHSDPLRESSVIAGDNSFGMFSMILEKLRPLCNYTTLISLSVGDIELDERCALQSFLMGIGRQNFIFQEENPNLKTASGGWVRSKKLLKERVERRIANFDRITKDPLPFLDRFDVRYVSLLSNQPHPQYLNTGWTQIQEGPLWQVWERR